MTFDKFVEYIFEYESDTFSADGSEINLVEARKVAELLLGEFVENDLDGVAINAAFEEVRED